MVAAKIALYNVPVIVIVRTWQIAVSVVLPVPSHVAEPVAARILVALALDAAVFRMQHERIRALSACYRPRVT